MNVAVAGSSGLIGSALCRVLESKSHSVRPLLRPSSAPVEGGLRWDPDGGTIDAAELETVDAVVCLSGHSIGARRWTERQKKLMRDSRVRSTAVLARAVASMKRKPRVFVASSAAGYYGDRGDEVLDERSAPGSGFLASLCIEWERATSPAAEAGVRVAWLRSGIVLSPRGGLLGSILPIFRLGLGGRLGSGKQWMPWISIEDQAGAIAHILEREDAAGPFNLVSPAPSTNADVTHALAKALHRPAAIPVPRFALRTIFGEEPAREAFLSSQRMLPRALEATGYAFKDPELFAATARLLRRK